MTYIKKISMTGFKSFWDRTVTIKLSSGFTCIVGPNGAGKSNIIDALNILIKSTEKLREKLRQRIGIYQVGEFSTLLKAVSNNKEVERYMRRRTLLEKMKGN